MQGSGFQDGYEECLQSFAGISVISIGCHIEVTVTNMVTVPYMLAFAALRVSGFRVLGC